MLKEDVLCIITNLFDSNRELSAKVAALEAEVEKFTSTNSTKPETVRPSCRTCSGAPDIQLLHGCVNKCAKA
jgi:hypothetical protein